jgi:hypothetical protein
MSHDPDAVRLPPMPLPPELPADDDQCHTLEVDGQTIRVHGQPMTEHEQSLLAEIVRAAKRRFETEHATERPVFPHRGPTDTHAPVSSLTRSEAK